MTEITLRDYQSKAVNAVMKVWRDESVNSVLLVSPTGSGKTVMLEEVCYRASTTGARILWVCHRDSLVSQAVEELRRRHPRGVGVIHPDYDPDPGAMIQVATIQSLLARGVFPRVELVVLDEAHHYVADDWGRVATHYRSVRVVGATATPERGDGRPLGDIFERMVVAEKYSTLIEKKHLLDARYWVPAVERGGIAMSPIDAWFKFGEGQGGFVFVGGVKEAKRVAGEFNLRGVPAAHIVASTPSERRAEILGGMRTGALKIVVNVYTMTEGVNIPNANMCILSRGCGSVATFVQMVGRVLRPDGDTPYAIVVALNSNVLAHGHPTEDREYALHGKFGVARAKGVPSLRQCLKCGFVWPSTKGSQCPECGWTVPVESKEPRIYNGDLKEVYKGDETEESAKSAELERLKTVARDRKFSIGWVVREYRKLFKVSKVPKSSFSPAELRQFYESLRATAKKRNYNPKWARGCFYQTFGEWP